MKKLGLLLFISGLVLLAFISTTLVRGYKTYTEREKPPFPDMAQPKEMIIVDYPKPNDTISSPLTIKGKARGGWYFEGDFPIVLYCNPSNLTVLAAHYASAKGEWMTDEFVEFSSTIEFDSSCVTNGLLELIKSNPSDMRELDDKIIIPVNFEKTLQNVE